MKKIKVLFVVTKSNFGGAQRYVYDLATGIPHDQFEAVVAQGGSGLLVNKLSEANIRTIPLSFLARDVHPFKDIASFFSLWKLFRAERPDVVHLNSAKASGLGALAARLAGVPWIIFTAHGWAFNEDRPPIQRILIKFFSWVTVVLAHKTIAVSDAVHNDTKKWTLIRTKVITIHNGIGHAGLLPREQARRDLFARAHINIPEDAFIVGTIAELHRNKGLEYAVDAFASLSQRYQLVYYFIMGSGEEEDMLNAMVKNQKLQGRIFLLGFVDNAANYLKAFDIFLLPSIKEGLSYVILEAGSAGLPVVASRIGGIPEIIEDSLTGLLVSPRTPEAISAALQSLIESPSDRNIFGSALRERIARNFSLADMVSTTSVLYKKI